MIQIVGTDYVVGGIEQVARNLEPGRMMETMGEVLEVTQEFHARTYGHGRKDLPQTFVRHPDSDGHLTETGALRDSVSRSDAPGAIRRVTPYGAEFGTSIWYGQFAQSGTPTERKRKVVKLTTPLRKAVREVVLRNIYRGAEGLLAE